MSTVQQDTGLQMQAFAAAGVEAVVQEFRSGAGVARPALDRLLQGLQPGDVLVVYKIDRLARSLVDLLKILSRLDAVGAAFRSLTEPLETATPVGRMMIQLLGVIAEFERAMIRERCEAGRRAARERGVRLGRPSVLDPAEVVRLIADGLTYKEVAQRLGCHRSSIARVLAAANGKRWAHGRAIVCVS